MSTISRTQVDTKGHDRPSAITPSIWWVGRSGWGGIPELTHPTDCNIYLLKGKNFDVLIDAGGNPSVAKLEANIRAVGSSPSRIREIWLTHSHGDHFLGAGVWAKKYPKTICRLPKLGIERFLKQDYRLIGSFHPPKPAHFHLPKNLLPLKEGSVLRCGTVKLTVEETPGHTPDCLVFRGKVDGIKVLIGSDTIIGDQPDSRARGGVLKGVVGWIDGYWSSNIPQFQKTVAKLAKKPVDLILPGHGVPHSGKAAASSLKNCAARLDRMVANLDMFNMGPYFTFGS